MTTAFGELAARLAAQRYRTTPGLVAEVLREAILRNVLKGGGRLRQDEIAASLGVSRIPVREALRQLEAEGLVTFYPHRGAVVSELSHEEVQEIYEIRIPLETTAIRLAVPHLGEDDLRRAEQILEAMDGETDVARWNTLNREFHTSLYAPANRPRLLALINVLRTNVERYLRIYISLMHHKPSAQREHRQIVAACRRRDAAAAAKALESHLGNTSRSLVTYLRKSRRKGPAADSEDRAPPDRARRSGRTAT